MDFWEYCFNKRLEYIFLYTCFLEFVYARCYLWRGLAFAAGFVTGAEIWNARQIVDVHIK